MSFLDPLRGAAGSALPAAGSTSVLSMWISWGGGTSDPRCNAAMSCGKVAGSTPTSRRADSSPSCDVIPFAVSQARGSGARLGA